MIKTFADKRTIAVFLGRTPKEFPPELAQRARRQLQALDSALYVDDLRLPPSNNLERLSGKRAGQRSIRINRQLRVCFYWHEGNAFDVEITDYH